ncbi:MAG: carbon-nitrogen hydrolase family protein [Pseudomonadota bacterium]
MITAVLQMNSGRDRRANWDQAAGLLARAAAGGARLAVLPEHFGCLVPEGEPHPHPEPLRGPTLAFLAGQARQHGLWLVGGSFAQAAPGGRTFNTSPLVDDQGRLVAAYRKIHLFDLALAGQPPWLESRLVAPGRRLTVAATPWGKLGMSICFDLRFPELYRRLRLMGAELIAAPSAFTQRTGQAHWGLLLRTRAVENQCYVLAGAQWGQHGGGRASFGAAMIVDPWGQTLACCPDGVGLALAEVDLERVAAVRATLDTAALARLLPAAWRKG